MNGQMWHSWWRTNKNTQKYVLYACVAVVYSGMTLPHIAIASFAGSFSLIHNGVYRIKNFNSFKFSIEWPVTFIMGYNTVAM